MRIAQRIVYKNYFHRATNRAASAREEKKINDKENCAINHPYYH